MNSKNSIHQQLKFLVLILLASFLLSMSFFSSFSTSILRSLKPDKHAPEKEPHNQQQQTEIDEWVTVKDGKLWLNGSQFRFISYNVPGLLMLEDLGFERWIPPNWEEQQDALLSIKGLNGKVVRSYTLGFGPRYHIESLNPLSVNEEAWIAFDQALHLARLHNIRCIIPIFNNHNGGDSSGIGNFGDYSLLSKMRRLPPSVFFTDPSLIQDTVDIITYLLNRRNSISGLRYGDDSTILAWQLGNELGGWEDVLPPIAWVMQMSSLIKSLSKSLVLDASIGYTTPSRYSSELLGIPSLDIFSNHYYWAKSKQEIQNDARHVVAMGKAFILGEIGFSFDICKDTLTTIVEDKRISGGLIWSLRYHSRNGGFYTHDEEGGKHWSFHVPGFPVSPGFGKDDERMALMVRGLALKLDGLSEAKVPFMIPQPEPVLLEVKREDEGVSIRYFGSAWAKSYSIHRRQADASEKEFKMIANEVSDGVSHTSPLFLDRSAVSGVIYEYQIKANGM